ncbi:MAG TPA: response regulator [Planctomycetota bacterium]|nr:response regulator [Planctomycetota bacterium]
MSRLRVLLVDDEPLARERLGTLLREEPDVEIVGECAGGREAIEAIRRERPDLVFLDVQMPEVDGFGVLEGLGGETAPAVIFVTAYEEHALRAFEVHALDYLLKPFDRRRFREALERARARVENRGTEGFDGRLRALLECLPPRPLERFPVKAGGRIVFVRAEEIDFVEANGNYVRLRVGGKGHLLRETMASLEGRLDPARFVRIHRSTIVNLDRVRELEPLFHGDYAVRLRDGTRLTMSRGYRARLERALGRPL